MKKRNILLCLMVITFGVSVAGQFTTSASEADSAEKQKTEAAQGISTEQEASDNQKTETMTEAVKEDSEDKTEEKVLKEGEEKGTDDNDIAEKSTGDGTSDSEAESDDGTTDNADNDIDEQDMDEDDISESLYYQGIRYYLNQYKYDCEIIYLQSCLEYIKLAVAASKDMYDMGELTAADVKSYEAQQASIEAQIQVARNQSSYNNLFLKENNLNYNDYAMKEKKSIESIDYYIEQYPAKNHMTMAGYVTSYNDALAYIEAKKVEIEALTMKSDSAKLLYEAGEVSKLELKQQEAVLAKAQYELEEYYVEMNLAYVNIKVYCR